MHMNDPRKARMTESDLDIYETRNRVTGEIVQGVRAVKPRAPKTGDYVRMGLKAMNELASDRTLNSSDLRLITLLFGMVDYNDRPLKGTPAHYARMLNMQPATVSRSLAKLVETGYVLKNTDPVRPNKSEYRLRHDIAFKGTSWGYVETKKSREAAQKTREALEALRVETALGH